MSASANTEIFKKLSSAFARNKLGHALLLSSRQAMGEVFQRDLLRFIRFAACMDPQDFAPCQHCDSCKLLTHKENAHPDVLFCRAEAALGYGVEQIRQLLAQVHLSRSLSPWRVILVEEAEKLSAGGGAAGNAFLKILEEPRPQSLYILTSSRPEALMSTIKSRCQHFRFPSVGEEISPALGNWQALSEWVHAGAQGSRFAESPADDESFWQDRAEATLELEEVFRGLWARSRGQWPQWRISEARRVSDFFARFEELIWKCRHYANPHLQWLQLRMDAKLENLWRP